MWGRWYRSMPRSQLKRETIPPAILTQRHAHFQPAASRKETEELLPLLYG